MTVGLWTQFVRAGLSASRSQARSIEQINTAVQQVDGMTQHNAALVEEINATMERTEEEATRLDSIVAQFRIEDQPDLVPAMASRAKPRLPQLRTVNNLAPVSDWDEF